MSDNTLQFEWIQLLTSKLFAMFRDASDVFVGGNLLWYPVEGFPKIRRAPDAFVVRGRPKGYRGSYKQWEENDVPMTVVFEVRSPNDSAHLMRRKLRFYDEYGVEEYYVIDPENRVVEVYRRLAEQLATQRPVEGSYTSPRLGIRIELPDDTLRVYHPDGRPFLAAEEKEEELVQLATERDQLQGERDRALQRAARLAELSRRVRRGEATPEELAEPERLEDEVAS